MVTTAQRPLTCARSRVARRTVTTGAAAAAAVLTRRTYLRWGATPEEVTIDLPGDQLLPVANVSATRAISVARPAADVWPWLAQLGQARGGFYSYDALENLIGCHMQSADHVVAAWQSVEVGTGVALTPEVDLAVAVVDNGRALVLRGAPPMFGRPAPYDFTWAFVLRDRPDGTTRLIVRERYQYLRRWAPLLVEPVQPISFVMSQKMLRGIRDRVIATTGSSRSAPETTCPAVV